MQEFNMAASKKNTRKKAFVSSKSLFYHRKRSGIEFGHRASVDKIVLLSECALEKFQNHHDGVNMAAKPMKHVKYGVTSCVCFVLSQLCAIQNSEAELRELGWLLVTRVLSEYHGIIMGDVSESMQQMAKQLHCRRIIPNIDYIDYNKCCKSLCETSCRQRTKSSTQRLWVSLWGFLSMK